MLTEKQTNDIAAVDKYINWLQAYRKFQPRNISISEQQYNMLLKRENEHRAEHNKLKEIDIYRGYTLVVT